MNCDSEKKLDVLVFTVSFLINAKEFKVSTRILENNWQTSEKNPPHQNATQKDCFTL